MIVKDLSGKEFQWKITSNSVSRKREKVSDLHCKARELIQKVYPTVQILEEVPIKIRHGETLYLDFYLPLHKIAVEVNGEQHYRWVSHFHAAQMDFIRQCKSDREKKEWCEINDISFVELRFDRIDMWQNLLENGNEETGRSNRTCRTSIESI
jgi:hypothetical protein